MIPGDYQLKIKTVTHESDDSVTISFKKPLFKNFRYKAGQYLTVILDIEGKTEMRAYSLNTADMVDRDIAITVKEVDNGKVSKYLNKKAKPGDRIRVLKPYGEFIFTPLQGKQQHLILFGAGSGITPLMSILKTALHKSESSKVTLIYANRSAKSIIFKQKLGALEKQFPYRLQVIHVVKIPEGGVEHYGGRLTPDTIRDIFTKWDLLNAKNPSYYLCGPSGFMDMVRDTLIDLKIDDKDIFSERFTAPETGNIPDFSLPAILEVKDRNRKKVREIGIKPKVNILDALLEAGYVLPYSCGNGICGTCKTRMLEGDVCMTLNMGLSEEEKSKKYILPCVSYATTERIKLHLE